MIEPVAVEVLLDDEAHLDDLRAAFRVEVDEAGHRLDGILARRGLRLAALGPAGRVRVDGRAVLVGAPRLLAGHEVVVLGDRVDVELLPERIPLAVLHDDPDLLVVDKPSGLPTHAGPDHPAGTLANAVRHLAAAGGFGLSGVEGPLRPGIVHRLDRDTSGAIVVAKN